MGRILSMLIISCVLGEGCVVFEMDSGKSTRLQIWVVFRSSGVQSLLGKWGTCKF